MANKIQLRRDTAANWTRNNPILADGELGLDITNNKVKAGDGTTAWASLPYLVSPEHSRLVNGSKVLTVETNGNVTLPGSAVLNSNSGNLNINSATNSNVKIITDSSGTKSTFKFTSSGEFQLPNGSVIDDVSGVLINGSTNTNVSIRTNTSAGGGGYAEWKFGADGNLTLPPNGLITTTQGYTGTSLEIINITQANPVVITTNGDHALYSGTNILITGISTMTELNGREFYVTTPSATTLALYEDPNCTLPVDSTGYTNYFTYGGHTITENGTAQYLFESPVTNPTGLANSLVFNGNQLIVPGGNDLNIGPNDDFTIEAYMRFSSTDLSSGYAPLFGSTHGSEGISLLTGANYMGIFKGTNGAAWIGGNFYMGQLSADTWYHVAFVRNQGKIRFYLDGAKYTGNWGDVDNDTTDFTNAGNSTIGTAVGHSCHGTQISNFRYVVGTAIYTGPFAKPTSPLTAVAGTKVLILGNGDFNDTSGSIIMTGGGTLLSEFAGADLTIALGTTGGIDPGSIILESKNIALRVNGRDDTIELSNPGGDYPINSSGQQTIELYAGSEGVPFTNINPNCNMIYITEAVGYTGSGNTGQTIQLQFPTRPGIELNIINDSECNVSIDLQDTPPYVMVPYENIKVTSYKWPNDNLNYWWVTNSFSWNY